MLLYTSNTHFKGGDRENSSPKMRRNMCNSNLYIFYCRAVCTSYLLAAYGPAKFSQFDVQPSSVIPSYSHEQMMLIRIAEIVCKLSSLEST